MRVLLLIIIGGVFLIGCSTQKVFFEQPNDFRMQNGKENFIKKYSKFVKSKKFYLDPGHGGEDRNSVGPQKLVVEADVNLNVALRLKTFLEDAGANVDICRTTDATVGLSERSELANKSNADYFISIHHNAGATDEDTWTNYTSVYYHGTSKDYVYEPSNHDLAKYIQRDLTYVMRNPGAPSTFDGTHSDYSIYPGAGFSVLRKTNIPAVLVECSFWSNPQEERKLADTLYNTYEAWGIFRGICRYLADGVPEINFVKEDANSLQFKFSDFVKLNPKSVVVMIDSVETDKYDLSNNLIFVKTDNVVQGSHEIRIIAQNESGNSTLPFRYKYSK